MVDLEPLARLEDGQWLILRAGDWLRWLDDVGRRVPLLPEQSSGPGCQVQAGSITPHISAGKHVCGLSSNHAPESKQRIKAGQGERDSRRQRVLELLLEALSVSSSAVPASSSCTSSSKADLTGTSSEGASSTSTAAASMPPPCPENRSYEAEAWQTIRRHSSCSNRWQQAVPLRLPAPECGSPNTCPAVSSVLAPSPCSVGASPVPPLRSSAACLSSYSILEMSADVAGTHKGMIGDQYQYKVIMQHRQPARRVHRARTMMMRTRVTHPSS